MSRRRSVHFARPAGHHRRATGRPSRGVCESIRRAGAPLHRANREPDRRRSAFRRGVGIPLRCRSCCRRRRTRAWPRCSTNSLERFRSKTTGLLLVAPHNMREGFTALIRREADHQRAGRTSDIRVKLNQLQDPEIIRELYKASQARVPSYSACVACAACGLGVPGRSRDHPGLQYPRPISRA